MDVTRTDVTVNLGIGNGYRGIACIYDTLFHLHTTTVTFNL